MKQYFTIGYCWSITQMSISSPTTERTWFAIGPLQRGLDLLLAHYKTNIGSSLRDRGREILLTCYDGDDEDNEFKSFKYG